MFATIICYIHRSVTCNYRKWHIIVVTWTLTCSPWTSGVYIKQTTFVHVTIIITCMHVYIVENKAFLSNLKFITYVDLYNKNTFNLLRHLLKSIKGNIPTTLLVHVYNSIHCRHIHAHILARTHMYVRTHVYTHKHTHTYTHTHTHKHRDLYTYNN